MYKHSPVRWNFEFLRFFQQTILYFKAVMSKKVCGSSKFGCTYNCGVGYLTCRITTWRIPLRSVGIPLLSFKSNRSAMFLLTRLRHNTPWPMIPRGHPFINSLFYRRVAYENIPSYYFMSQSFQSSSRPHAEPWGPLHNKCTLVQ